MTTSTTRYDRATIDALIESLGEDPTEVTSVEITPLTVTIKTVIQDGLVEQTTKYPVAY